MVTLRTCLGNTSKTEEPAQPSDLAPLNFRNEPKRSQRKLGPVIGATGKRLGALGRGTGKQRQDIVVQTFSICAHLATPSVSFYYV